MASKRNLYRPAQVQENVGQRKNRKTLAQGRLITNGGTSHSGFAGPGVASLSTSHVSNTSGNVSRLHQTSLVQGQFEASLFSPRRAVPKVTEPKSPKLGQPAGSLDLTDSEVDEKSPDGRSRYQKPVEVLCIDASRQTVNPDLSEVDIRIGVDKSPVKIVCHSPARVNHASRLATATDAMVEKGRQSKPRTPIIIKEKIAGSHIEPQTAVQFIPMSPSLGDRRVLQSLPTNYPQPNFDDSGESEIFLRQAVKGDQDDKEDQLSATSDHDVSSLKDYVVTNHKTKPSKPTNDRIPSSAKKDLQKKPETAKKKKGRVVPSRYMQVVESKAKASLSGRMDKSSFDKSSKVSRSMDATPAVKKTTKKVRSADSKAPSKQQHLDRPHTPENQSMTSTGGKTSTPTMDGSMFTHEMDIDASAIHPEVSILSAGDNSRLQASTVCSGKTRSRLKKDLTDKLMGQSILSNMSVYNQSTVSSKPKQKLDAKSLQNQLDLMWMYDLQWTFLEAKAKKTFHDQEKQAMAQLLGLHEEVEKLRKIKAEKEQQYSRLKHTNMTDNLAEIQRQCLGPVTSSLPLLQKHHRGLAQALDTTRHQIPTKDIHLPSDEEQLQAKLEAQLLESERLLGEISAVTRQDAPNITDMADALVSMETAVDGMESELKKSRELLAATETLTMHECSLRVQEIQLLGQS